MFLAHLALLNVVTCLDIQVQGDLAFDMRVPASNSGRLKWFRQGWDSPNEKHELVLKIVEVRGVTAAPELECTYQYPEPGQVNAMLSHMMNELTKVFIRSNDFISGLETRRLVKKKKSHNTDEKEELKKEEKKKRKKVGKKNSKREGGSEPVEHRMEDTRFKVVNMKQKEFFEDIYANMTQEYRDFYNSTVERVDRSGRDPCQHQDEVRQLWRDLLEHSLLTLNAASERCVEEYLREQRVDPASRVRARLRQYLTKELGKVRASLLDMLCDTYQLCYNELLT